jgi:hypothetical protein
MSDDERTVRGYCPMGCGETLFIASGGYVTCSFLHCPAPDAVATILDDRETEHVVELGEENFTVRHPLRERLNDELLTCDLHNWLMGLDGPPRLPGRYRASHRYGSWLFVAAETPANPSPSPGLSRGVGL